MALKLFRSRNQRHDTEVVLLATHHQILSRCLHISLVMASTSFDYHQAEDSAPAEAISQRHNDNLRSEYSYDHDRARGKRDLSTYEVDESKRTDLSKGKDRDSSGELDAIEPSTLVHQLIEKKLGDPVVEVRGLCKSYELQDRDSVQVLRQVSLTWNSEIYPVLEGEFVMIRGASGCGKTTFLNCIAAIDTPTAGSVQLFGKKLEYSSTAAADDRLSQLRLEHIGFVFQTYNLLPALSAFENVELPMVLIDERTAKERTALAKSLLKMVGLEDRVGHLPSELSGGEQQRVTIARAMANNPELLVLDEPTGDLDTKNTISVMNLLLSINREERKTMIMVTHNECLGCYADRVLFFEDGMIKGQAINVRQSKLDEKRYLAYLNRQ